MGDEWVCKECGYAASVDPGDKSCPECGNKMINIGEVDDDLKTAKDQPVELYDEVELETPLEEEFGKELEDEETISTTDTAKGKKQ